jgi:sugar phosphate isomerase/epimerase
VTWQVGVSTGAYVGDVSAALDAIQAAGFHGIEVGTPPGHFDPWNLDQVRALAGRLRETGVAPVSIHAPFGGLLDLSDPNPQHRHAAVGGILAAASALRELGGRIVVVHTTDVPREGQDVAARLSDCASALAVLVRSCTHMGMTVAVENALPHLIGGHPDEFATVLARIGEDARVCIDTSHATLAPGWERWFDVAGPRIVHVHANDHHGDWDSHLAPGDGIVPWGAIACRLRQARFGGWLVLELNRDLTTSPEALSRARERLLALLG